MSGSTNCSSPPLTQMASWSRIFWTSIMDVGHSRRCWRTKISKKILTDGVPTPGVGKNSGKSRVNGCGICASHWDRRCREVSYARSSGPTQRSSSLCRGCGKPTRRVWPVAVGCGVQTSHGAFRGRGLRDAARTGHCAVQREQACG